MGEPDLLESIYLDYRCGNCGEPAPIEESNRWDAIAEILNRLETLEDKAHPHA
jgi:uncharacterized protein YrzB (UPF0473 family)